MGKYLDMVKKRAIEKRKELEQDPAAIEQNFTDMAIAEKFLRHDKGFAVSQPIMSLVVLKFLGYSEEEIKDLYFKLVYEQSTEDKYSYVDPDKIENSVSNEPDREQNKVVTELKPEQKSHKTPKDNPSEEITKTIKTNIPEPEPPRMGRLIYREDGEYCQTDLLPLDPEHETYYYTKYCLGKMDANKRLYTLVGNEWIRGGAFMSYYFDAQYDYWEIDYILEP